MNVILVEKTKNRIKKGWLTASIILLIVCFLLELLKRNPVFLERMFPHEAMMYIKSQIFWVFGTVQLSIAEVLLYITAGAVLFCLVFFIVQLIKQKQKMTFLLNFIAIILTIVCVLQIFFTIFCGLDYYRTSLATKLGLTVSPQSKEVLILATEDILIKTNEASLNVNRNEEGIFTPLTTQKELFAYSNTAYQTYFQKNNLNYISYSTPKPVKSSELMNYLLISGFYFPFTGEANINIKEGNLYLPLTICHEKAHQYGVMREDEANFLAYLVCIQSGHPDFIYSGYIKAFSSLASQLYKVDKAAYQVIISQLDENILKDIQDYNDRLSAYEGAISTFSNNVNHTYLKAQGQSSGVQSYGKMADLLIAHYLANHA